HLRRQPRREETVFPNLEGYVVERLPAQSRDRSRCAAPPKSPRREPRDRARRARGDPERRAPRREPAHAPPQYRPPRRSLLRHEPEREANRLAQLPGGLLPAIAGAPPWANLASAARLPRFLRKAQPRAAPISLQSLVGLREMLPAPAGAANGTRRGRNAKGWSE